ncbi:M28 family peptidase [Alteromonas sp. CYL-A6]|uniref:M28 family peptidase n=1 Tax=Alteromonas nitratireducens TaxID=3390813 RepID=UPI0034B7B834
MVITRRHLFCLLFMFWGHAVMAAALTSAHKQQALADLAALSATTLAGRETGTAGSIRAAAIIAERFGALGLAMLGNDYRQPFVYQSKGNQHAGVNVAGMIKGVSQPARVIVISAHYDHLGIQGGRIYPGADDNASGVAALLLLAEYFSQYPPAHTLMFVAFDAEEPGLHGSAAWLAARQTKGYDIRLNINLDMLANGGRRNALFVFFSDEAEFLKPAVRDSIAKRDLPNLLTRIGRGRYPRDVRGAQGRINWRQASDHASFMAQNIAAVFIGSHTHQHYHQPSDTFENVVQAFFNSALEVALDVALIADGQLSPGRLSRPESER